MKNSVIIDQTRPDQTRPDQTYNYGLSLLKIWMSFEVVLAHFWNREENSTIFLKLFSKTTSMAVPVFMFVAFLLSGTMIMNRSRDKINSRLYKLYMMNVVWAVVYFLCFMAARVIFGKGIFVDKNFFDIISLFIGQLILAHSLNPTLWFQIDLIVITILFAFIYYRLSKRTAFYCIMSLGVLAVIFQYSGLNVFIFWRGNSIAKYTPGRICEMIPFACLGILFVKYDIMSKLKIHRRISIAFFTLMFSVSFLLGKYIPRPSEGFQYQGLNLLLSSVSLAVIFYLLPMDKLPDYVRLSVKNLSRLTPLVYCMHLLVARYVGMIFHVNNGFSFIGCVAVYVICLALGFAISLTSMKLTRNCIKHFQRG